MIELDISTALFIYLFFSTTAIFVVWFLLDFGIGLKTFSSDEENIWHCSICSANYIDSRHDELSVCPQCGSYNQRPGNLNEEGKGYGYQRISNGGGGK